jgi:predicted transcriptional regulator
MGMGVATINISFQRELLAEIDATAKAEARSRSELLREAARMYVARRRRWEAIFAFGEGLAARRKLTEKVIDREIQAYRKGRAARG